MPSDLPVLPFLEIMAASLLAFAAFILFLWLIAKINGRGFHRHRHHRRTAYRGSSPTQFREGTQSSLKK